MSTFSRLLLIYCTYYYVLFYFYSYNKKKSGRATLLCWVLTTCVGITSQNITNYTVNFSDFFVITRDYLEND